ncbi:DUF1552 domain-containing protein [Cellvibrio sp. UBA7671]|uniref:DUF1552 domain-containing protein n=1 Tax=Cellvibrio sp. UBA7671 TaxID=1946312 RepID=UPI002F35AF69
MKKPNIDQFDKKRRDLIKLISAAGISKGLLRASPLVSAMMYSRMAEAQSSVDKIVTLYIGNGALPEMWHGQPGNLPPFSAPLNEVADNILMVDGVQARNPHVGQNLGHGIIKLLMNKGWGGGESFDVNMGRILGAGKRHAYLIGNIHQNFNNQTNGVSRDSGNDAHTYQNPMTMFEAIFGAGTATPATTNVKKHIVDGHLEAVKALQSKLGQDEKIRLDAHLTAIEEKANQLASDPGTGGGGGSCGSPAALGAFPLNMGTIREQFRAFTDVFALAMKCNLTNSAMLYFGDDNAELSFSGVKVGNDAYNGTMHTAAHDHNNGRKSNSCCDQYPQWLAQRSEATKLQAYMIKKFRDEGLLSSTIVAQVSDAGNGDAHDAARVPIVIAGGGVGNRRSINASGANSHDVWHSLAVKLGANESGRYQGFSNKTIF